MDEPRIIPTPRRLTVAVTGRCNLRCAYCYYANEMVALNDLPTEQWLAFFEELGRLSVMTVALTGGEAFTRRDLFTLIDSIVANRMRYSILTNGTLITEKTLEQFAIGDRRSRLDSIQVSIDGSCAEIHDRSRPKSFERALRGLRLLTEAGYPVTVRVTINRHNLYDLENIARLLLDDVELPSFSTNDAVPVGTGCTNEQEITLTRPEQAEAMAIMAGLMQRYPGRLVAQAGSLARLRMFAEMDHARATGEKTDRWQMGRLSACGCTFASLDILHDGSIVPCNMLPDLTLGNITSDSIEEIWRTHATLQTMRTRRNIPMQDVPGCTNCEWAPYCNGSCPGLPHQMTGDLNRANPLDCYRRFLMEKDGVHAE